MMIFLVRHGEAIERTEEQEDSLRWLTKKGRKLLHKAGRRLHKKRVRPDYIITSPLTRAVQTAELILSYVGHHTELMADRRLAPDASVEQMVEMIHGRYHDNKDESVMLVGHEPLLSQCAARLLGKESVAPLVKGACLHLELRDKPRKPVRFHWYAPPTGQVINSAKKALEPDEA